MVNSVIVPLSDEVRRLNETEVIKKIKKLRGSYGSRVVLLSHHYQRKEIAAIADFKGDSLELSRIASQQEKARYIIFCGVHFMAESAAVLSQPGQVVVMPELSAGCPMADMADLLDVERAWDTLTSIYGKGSIIPITYMNSPAEVKAFCGAHGGSICTSSNAKAVMKWVLDKGKKVLFIPDEHLGRNTANLLNIPRERVIVWDPHRLKGGNNNILLKNVEVLLWKGYCHVHTHFTVDDVKKMRERFPDAKIIVHPECKEEVVNAVDAQGSTSYIVKYVEAAPSGSTIIIGTEINLISRLADEHPDKRIYELARSLCPNMFRINPHSLYYTLLNLGKINVITVPEEVIHNARTALQRMLEIK